MALTQFEKDCIDDIHAHLTKNGRASTDLDTIKHGTEAERQTLITDWINGVNGITAVDARIADIDAAIAELNTQKTALQTKKTDMQNYVA